MILIFLHIFRDDERLYPFRSVRLSNNELSFGPENKKPSKKLAKKRKHNGVVINEENGTFTPLIFSCNGGMSIETRKFFQRLSELTSEKHHQNFSDTSAWIKRKLKFCLLRTAVVCIRGSRSANMLSHW